MSYDIGLKDPVTGRVIELDEPHQMRGGTYALGETTKSGNFRTCSRCGTSKIEGEFPKDKRYKICNDCKFESRATAERMPEKRCTRCDKIKAATLFPGPRFRTCRDCYSRRITDHNKKSIRYKNYMRDYSLRRLYGIGVADFEAMMESQGGKCAICRSVPTDKYRLRVDHDHATGAIRGLLCNSCNSGLGRLGDDVERLRAALAYLERYSSP